MISPGSRSAPLTYALAELAEAGGITLHVRIDERDAAFLALGTARGERAAGLPTAPVAVITTSGSAVGNLQPAVLEAAYSHLPLLLLTADRPARLRGIGANQTIDDQAHVLSDVVARVDLAHDAQDALAQRELSAAIAASCGRRELAGALPGPVQFNVQFDLPLEPGEDDPPFADSIADSIAQRPERSPGEPGGEDVSQLDSSFLRADVSRAVLLAGDAFGYSAHRVGEFAAATGIPVLAEPSSALVTAARFVPRHAAVLSGSPELCEQITDVFEFGKVTLFRPDAALLADPRVRVHRIQADLDTVSPDAWQAALANGPLTSADPEWFEAFAEAAPATSTGATSKTLGSPAGLGLVKADKTVEESQHLALTAVDAVRAALAGASEVLVASSSVVRHLDAITVPPEVRIHASRGLAGIDGLVSTAVGLSVGLGSTPHKPLRLLIGDVAMLHDVGGLLREAHESVPSVQIVILNDDGGAIFAGLEHGKPHLQRHFARFFGTSHGRTFEHLAAAYGWPYARCTTAAEVLAAGGQPGIVEIALPPVTAPR